MSRVASDTPVRGHAEPEPELDDRVARVGMAWRELRRGASMQALRERIYGSDEGMVDMGLAAALEVVSLEGPCRMRVVADVLRVDPSTATRTIDRLVDKGYVERIADPDDARAVLVATTPAGDALRERVTEQARVAMTAIMHDFSDDEADQLANLMARLVEGVDRYIAETAE